MEDKESNWKISIHDLDEIVKSAKLDLDEEVNKSSLVESSKGLSGESEKFYKQETERIISESIHLLDEEYESKKKLRRILSVFFLILLSVQFVILGLLLIFNKKISEGLSITYITSVFVETLGVIVLMVKFAFDNSKEIEIIEVLNSFMSSYQKYNSDKK